MPTIRIAHENDAEQTLKIYAPYIQNTSITFETEVPSVSAFMERTSHYLKSYPWLVCDVNGTIAGYAYASQYRERVAYQWSVESSVYVHDDFKNQHIAAALYTALMSILKLQNFHNVYAVINLPNPQSVAFHEKMKFEYFATYKNVGYKLGQWKNVGWWQLQLNDYTDEPVPPTKFPEINKEVIDAILQSAESILKPHDK